MSQKKNAQENDPESFHFHRAQFATWVTRDLIVRKALARRFECAFTLSSVKWLDAHGKRIQSAFTSMRFESGLDVKRPLHLPVNILVILLKVNAPCSPYTSCQYMDKVNYICGMC